MRRFGSKDIPKDYPRPQMYREGYEILDGMWEYAITEGDTVPLYYDGMIKVPFAPESRLSGVVRKIMPWQCLWYHKAFKMDEEKRDGRYLLHFGSVDQEVWVYINGFLTAHHGGGYLGFSIDITQYLSADNDILVKVKDYTEHGRFAYGSQSKPEYMQSGIWQSVWMEYVPKHYIRAVMITPLYEKGMVRYRVIADRNYICTAVTGKQAITFPANIDVEIKLDKVIKWTPERPYLYDVTFEMEGDVVRSYFGMRKFSTGKNRNGKKCFFLNNKPYKYQKVIDMGYYEDGIYTASSDEEITESLLAIKKKGFNMIRKSGKVEPLRWYYHCDRMGILVLQEHIRGAAENSREQEEMKRMLRNVTSLVKWVSSTS